MTFSYKSLGNLLRGRPNPPKQVSSIEPPAFDEAPDPVPAVIDSPPTVLLPRPVDVLLAALDAADNDPQRAALLAAAPATVREELAGALTYRQMVTPPRNAALDTLVATLDGAADDAQRAALLSGASPTLRAALADRLWWRNATPDDAQEKYLALAAKE